MMDFESALQSLEPKSIKRSALVEVDGISLPHPIAEEWAQIWDFKALHDDLLICTYPKAGTTWIQEIVDMLQHEGDPKSCARAPIYQRMPFIEAVLPKPFPSGTEEAEAMPPPRTLKTHLPVQLLPPSFWEQNCKLISKDWKWLAHFCSAWLFPAGIYVAWSQNFSSALSIIYVARNAKDNAVSYFHFHRMSLLMPEPGNWDQFLDNFLVGNVAWGSWFGHVRGWWEAKDRHPILYLFYEDLKEDPAREIQKVAHFLGLEVPEPVLNRIVQHTTFESMKANPTANYTTLPSFIMDQAVSPFMRKGTVGNWKEHFTVAQSEQLDKVYARELGDNILTFRTQL